MPRGDRTGPLGEGPMTGRAAGYCAGYSVPGFYSSAPGYRAWGRGYKRGYRRYWRTGYPAPPPAAYPAPAPYQVEPKDELTYLENMAAQLKKELETIAKRMEELSKKETE